MKKIVQAWLATMLMLTLTSNSNATEKPLEKPQSMEEMWKIIQAQQQQINEMKKSMQTVSKKAEDAEMAVLKRKTSVLSEEVEKLRTELFIPEDIEYKSAYGLGPAASKVYQVSKGLSIGGYGEASYRSTTGDDKKNDTNEDQADFGRLVLYAGYKFTDSILFNSEIEFEHGSTDKNGSVSVEFAALDFMIDPLANVRAGMVLMPMGFINQIHEPPFYFGNNRPEVEKQIIPSTWREIGVGAFGELLPGLTYTSYVVNGLDAANFNSKGIRSGRQKASKAKANDLAFVGRMDYAPAAVPGLTVGASAYLGDSGQNQKFNGRDANAFTQLYEAHLEWKYRGLEFRTLGSWGHIDDADILSAAKGETIGEENYGWYAEVGYDIMPHIAPDSTQYLAPFIRFETLDTIASAPDGFLDDESKNQKIFQIGFNYKPIPNVVIKADYRNMDSKAGDLPDDFNLGVGFIF